MVRIEVRNLTKGIPRLTFVIIISTHFIEKKEKLEVNITKGMPDFYRIVFPEKSDEGINIISSDDSESIIEALTKE